MSSPKMLLISRLDITKREFNDFDTFLQFTFLEFVFHNRPGSYPLAAGNYYQGFLLRRIQINKQTH